MVQFSEQKRFRRTMRRQPAHLAMRRKPAHLAPSSLCALADTAVCNTPQTCSWTINGSQKVMSRRYTKRKVPHSLKNERGLFGVQIASVELLVMREASASKRRIPRSPCSARALQLPLCGRRVRCPHPCLLLWLLLPFSHSKSLESTLPCLQ